MGKKQSISVLVPTYNEADLIRTTVTELVSYLKTLDGASFEVIVCANGCTDETEAVLQKLSKKLPEVRYLSLPQKGFGLALSAGIKHAKKDLVTFVPGDGEINPAFIGDALILMDTYDFVSGSRYLTKTTHGSSMLRKLLSSAFTLVFRMSFGFSFTEIGTVKAFKTKWAKSIVDKLTEPNYAWQIQIIYHALASGLRIAETPVAVELKRNHSQSKVQILSDSIALFTTCVKYGALFRAQHIKRKLVTR